MRGPGRGKDAGLSDLRLADLEQVSQALREYLRKMATERARLGRWSPAPARRSRPQTPTKGTASAGPGDRMVLRAPAGGGQAAGTAGASWHGQIFVRLNQDGGAQTVSREGSLTLRTGATRVLEVSSEDTVAMVKERIPGAERLVFGGKDLPDHATLAECGVPRDSTIDALPRCLGGAPTDVGDAAAEMEGGEPSPSEHLASAARALVRAEGQRSLPPTSLRAHLGCVRIHVHAHQLPKAGPRGRIRPCRH